jgi:hypothetical protein
VIIRREQNGNFTIVPNEVVSDERLSIEARGTLAYLLSKPNNWKIRHGHLQNALCVGREKLQRMLRELVILGYLERDDQQPRDGNNQFLSFNYVVRDTPRKDGVAFPPQAGFPLRRSRRRESSTGNKNDSNKTDIPRLPLNPPHAAASVLTSEEEAAEEALSEFGKNAQTAGCRFVWEQSAPYKAWLRFRGEDGMPPLDLASVKGEQRRGVWLPSLWPPRAQSAEDVS